MCVCVCTPPVLGVCKQGLCEALSKVKLLNMLLLKKLKKCSLIYLTSKKYKFKKGMVL